MLVLRFIVMCDGGGAIANVQGWVSASAVGNVRAFATAATIGDIDNAVCVGKAVGNGEVVGAAAADDVIGVDNAGIVSNPTAVAETQGWWGAGDNAGGTDEAVSVVAAAAGDVGVSSVEHAVVTAAVVVIVAGGGIIGVAAGAVSTDGADVVAGPAFAVAVGDVGVSGIGIEGAGIDGAGSVGGAAIDVAVAAGEGVDSVDDAGDVSDAAAATTAGAVIAETRRLWGAGDVGSFGLSVAGVEGVC